MTIQTSHLNELTNLIEFLDLPSSDGTEYALEEGAAKTIAEEVLDAYLIMRKDELPEAKVEGSMIYAGNQAVPLTSSVDDLMDKAMSLLAAASAITLIEEKRREEEKREQEEILSAFNSIAQTKRNSWSTLTINEQLAGREIVRLRGLSKSFI